MKRSALFALWMMAFFAHACGSSVADVPHTCTADLHLSVEVTVRSPEGLKVDEVTEENDVEDKCEANSDMTFDCYEQGGGKYIIRVRSGKLIWTRTIQVQFDGCHVPVPAQTLTITITKATADPMLSK